MYLMILQKLETKHYQITKCGGAKIGEAYCLQTCWWASKIHYLIVHFMMEQEIGLNGPLVGPSIDLQM